MNERTKRRGRGGLIALLIVIVLLALVCAAPFVYNAVTQFAYDDCETLAEGWEELFALSAAGDGEHLLFHMDKGSVYRLMLDGGALDAAEKELGGKAAIEQIGYTLHPGTGNSAEAEVRAAIKVFGFLPMQLRALADVSVIGSDKLSIKPREVWYGQRIRFGAEKLAKWTGTDEFTEGFTVSLGDYTEPLRADAIRLEGEGLTVSSPLLSRVIDEVAAAAKNETVVRLLRLYYRDFSPAALALEGGRARTDFIDTAGTSYADLRSALRDITAYGSDTYRRDLMAELDGLPFDICSLLEEYPRLREAGMARIAEAQAAYGQAQLDLRSAYWHKEVMLREGRLTEMDGTLLEERLPAEWEARIVLQYNEAYDAIVKTNEGNPRLQVPIPGLPMMSELKRDSRASLPAEGDGPFDLTLALRLPSGVPVVVFLTAEDEFGLAVISEDLFREFGENARVPVCSSAVVCTQPRDRWLRLTGLGDDLPVGNYIGLD